MANVTQQQYEALVVSQLTELWTQYGNLTERTLDVARWRCHRFSVTMVLHVAMPQCGSTAATRAISQQH
jgi:hypothetical protein